MNTKSNKRALVPEDDGDEEMEKICKHQMIGRSNNGIEFSEKPVNQENNEDDEEPGEIKIEKPKKKRGGRKKKHKIQSVLTGIDDLKALVYIDSKDINPDIVAKDQSVALTNIKANNKKKKKNDQVLNVLPEEADYNDNKEEEKQEEVPIIQVKAKKKAKKPEPELEEQKQEEQEEQEEQGEKVHEEYQEEYQDEQNEEYADEGEAEADQKSHPLLDVEKYYENVVTICKHGEYAMFVKITSHTLLMADKFYKNQRIKKRKAGKDAKKLDPNIKDYAKDRKIMKYYDQRYFLFSKYDEGVVLDYESWYSVTPECVAKYLAKRLENSKVIVDAFCGAGGNAIQFAKKGQKVIANDFDSKKIELVEKNAQVYGVTENIELKNEDFLTLDVEGQNADLVFLAPPWGGVNYCNQEYSIFEMVTPDVRKIIEKAMSITHNQVWLLGRNTSVGEIVQLFCEYFENHQLFPSTCSLEIEKININGKIKEIAVYYGPHSTVDRGIEISYTYSLFGNNAKAKNILKPLFKEKGLRPFLKWYAKQEKEKDFTVEDALNYKEYLKTNFPSDAPQAPQQ